MTRSILSLHRAWPLVGLLLAAFAAPAGAQARSVELPPFDCRPWTLAEMKRNPTEAELRCRFAIRGPGRFGLLSYLDVPVYQPATPMPGTHLVGLAGHAGPRPGESYEAWEWRVLRTEFGPEVRSANRGLDVLDPRAAARILTFEGLLRKAGIPARRLETWRSPDRQAYLFQQGRSRPGPLATTTLTSWHSQVDERGNPAGRAVDYAVPSSHLPRFHQMAQSVGLDGFGADSNDPGHVFLPSPGDLPGGEVVLLRVLPRVPVVTLATGLPVDHSAPPGGRAVLRAAALEFAAQPFIRYVSPDVQGDHVTFVAITGPVGAPAAPSVAAGGM